MRALAFVVIIGLMIVLTDLFPFDHLQNRIYGEKIHLDALATNIKRLSDDVVEVLVSHPSLERLQARGCVFRAMYSCDYAFMAVPSEISDFSKAIQLDPSYARAYGYRASAITSIYHQGLGYSREQIISDFNMVIDLAPSGELAEVAYDNLVGEYDMGLRQPDKAVEVCNKAIANLPMQNANVFFHMRANLYRKLGYPDKAQSDEAKAKSLEPNYISTEQYYLYQMRWISWLAIILAPFFALILKQPVLPVAIIE